MSKERISNTVFSLMIVFALKMVALVLAVVWYDWRLALLLFLMSLRVES